MTKFIFTLLIVISPLFSNISHAEESGLLGGLLQRYFNTRQVMSPTESNTSKQEPRADPVSLGVSSPNANNATKEVGYCSGKQREMEKKLDEESSVYEDPKTRSFMYEYKVIGDGKVRQVSGKKDVKINFLISEILQVIPDKVVNKYIESFRVDDSKENYNASIVQATDRQKFIVMINRRSFAESPIKNIFTIVHEIGHIVAMRKSEISGSGLLSKITCKTLNDSNLNCYGQDSLLYKFKKAFYSHGDGKNSGSKSENDYVSDYAKSGGYMEDFAESFRFYVLDTDLTKEKSGEAYAKIEFFRLNQNSGELNMEELKKDIRAKVSGSSFCNY